MDEREGIQWFENENEFRTIQLDEIKKYNENKILSEMRRKSAISGYDVEKMMKKVFKEEKKKKRAKICYERKKRLYYFIYKNFHFGMEHPDVLAEKRYTNDNFLNLYRDYQEDKGKDMGNIKRKMWLNDDGSFMVGKKLVEENESLSECIKESKEE